MPKQRKIKRTKHLYRDRKKGKIFKTILFILIIGGLVAAGYFAAPKLMEMLNSGSSTEESSQAPESSLSEESEPSIPAEESSTGSLPSEPESSVPESSEPESSESAQNQMKAYSPAGLSTLDLQAVAEEARKAKEAGYQAMVLTLKGEDGQLLYASDLEQAAAWGTIVEAAPSAAEIANVIRENGLVPIASIHAFKDPLAASMLRDNAYQVTDSPGDTWFDNVPSAGGKKWLNPYRTAAREYIVGIAEELVQAGFEQILAESVQFPDGVQYRMSVGETGGLTRAQILRQFTEELDAACPGKILVSFPYTAMAGQYAGRYEESPLYWQAEGIAPAVDLRLLDSTELSAAAGEDHSAYGLAYSLLSLAKDSVAAYNGTILPVVYENGNLQEVLQALEALDIQTYILRGESSGFLGR